MLAANFVFRPFHTYSFPKCCPTPKKNHTEIFCIVLRNIVM